MKKANQWMMKTAINISHISMQSVLNVMQPALKLRLLMSGAVRLTDFLFYFLPSLICTHLAEGWAPHLCIFGADCSQREMNNELFTCFSGSH